MPISIYEKVIERDKGLCQICFAQAKEVHHIVYRSHFGKKSRHIRDSERNLISLCLTCHESCHKHKNVSQLLRLMAKRYKYEYPEPIFRRWLNE